MRLLYVATIGGFMPFFKSFIRELLDEGHKVDIAANMSDYPLPDYYKEWGCGIYQISCSRSPINKGNIDAIHEIKKILKENYYDIVHCHTPVAAVCTRLACRTIRKKGTKVFYTAHGFHFYTGAPIKNWILFYPIEKICSKWTDVLITINTEDYNRAKKCFNIKRIEYVPGVGIDVKKFSDDSTNKLSKREELRIPSNAYVLLSVGELNHNKNHQIVVRALGKLNDRNVHYVIAGKGDQKEALQKIANDLGLGEQLHLIGYRSDISELYKMADVYILPSYREGLNVSVMEAMSSGLPCIVSDIRGNRDLVDNKGGFLFLPSDLEALVNYIKIIKDNTVFGEYNKIKSSIYDENVISKQIQKIYFEECGDEKA